VHLPPHPSTLGLLLPGWQLDAFMLAPETGVRIDAAVQLLAWGKPAVWLACRAWVASAANQPQRAISPRLFAPSSRCGVKNPTASRRGDPKGSKEGGSLGFGAMARHKKQRSRIA
jgi:hypothetical protein